MATAPGMATAERGIGGTVARAADWGDSLVAPDVAGMAHSGFGGDSIGGNLVASLLVVTATLAMVLAIAG